MQARMKELLHRFSVVLEFIIAGLLCVGALYFTVCMAGSIFQIRGFAVYESFEELLSTAFSLVIGIEIIRMMCEHSSAIVFEVLTFAIARQIVIDHTHAVDNLYGMAAIALIFLIRKYLLPGLPDHPDRPLPKLRWRWFSRNRDSAGAEPPADETEASK